MSSVANMCHWCLMFHHINSVKMFPKPFAQLKGCVISILQTLLFFCLNAKMTQWKGSWQIWWNRTCDNEHERALSCIEWILKHAFWIVLEMEKESMWVLNLSRIMQLKTYRFEFEALRERNSYNFVDGTTLIQLTTSQIL